VVGGWGPGVIVWLNGTHGAGKTTTSRLLQPLLPGSRILDAEKVGEVLMDVTPGLPESDNFQHWDPWRPLVVETARRVHEYVGGPLIMPMTVLVEAYWREIAAGLASHGVPVRHFVLPVDESPRRDRIQNDPIMGPSTFRFAYVDAYAEAARGWLHDEAEVIDATEVPATKVARAVADAVTSAR
jgi:hypothetical protein